MSMLHLEPITIEVPLDPKRPELGDVEVFARVVARRGGEQLPYLLYLQGGPGCESPRPGAGSPPWLETALERHRVVFLDQRGTGLSSPVGDEILERPIPDALDLLSRLRADAIVRDCEALRERLGGKRWSVLGQSFGGFTLMHYLGRHPEAIQHAYFTGGLPPVGHSAEEAYALTFEKMADESARFFRRFPEDADRMRRLADLAHDGALLLPDGAAVSPSLLQSVGHLLGASGGDEKLHWLLELDPTSNAFRHDLAAALPFGLRNPLYAVIHESCMADGQKTTWAAARVRPDEFDEDPLLLTGEHLMPDWFDELPAWQPWSDLANAVADLTWPSLYDEAALCDSCATGAAAVYFRDVYVPFEYSMEAAELVPGVETWVTSEYAHNGLRASGGRVLQRLFDLADGTSPR